MLCIYCNSKKVIKHGFQSGKQRYRCKDCKKVFCETSTGLSYSRSEKRLLSMLLNMLENNFYGKADLQEVLKLSKKYHNGIGKIRFNTKSVKQEHMKDTALTLNCYNPKLLICSDDKNITFYQIPAGNLSDDASISGKSRSQRLINIIDNVALKNIVFIQE